LTHSLRLIRQAASGLESRPKREGATPKSR